MNFPTHRVEPARLTSEEPTDFGGFTSASSEDEVPVSFWTYALAVVGFLSIVLVLGLSVGYWFRLF